LSEIADFSNAIITELICRLDPGMKVNW